MINLKWLFWIEFEGPPVVHWHRYVVVDSDRFNATRSPEWYCGIGNINISRGQRKKKSKLCNVMLLLSTLVPLLYWDKYSRIGMMPTCRQLQYLLINKLIPNVSSRLQTSCGSSQNMCSEPSNLLIYNSITKTKKSNILLTLVLVLVLVLLQESIKLLFSVLNDAFDTRVHEHLV